MRAAGREAMVSNLRYVATNHIEGLCKQSTSSPSGPETESEPTKHRHPNRRISFCFNFSPQSIFGITV